MEKTATEHNFEIEISDMMKLIDSQSVTVKDAKHLVSRSINLLVRYQEMKASRDNHKIKRAEAESKLKELKNANT